ncbi:patatin-like phospholipase family protein [Flavobacterium channae]|uniref:patatin-like phospholipase family protein n=1 Tax=Flavobacterium channae TaxID=2897181 RepID=UPI001E2D0652|nr:patatin-like phospholipase family protein [Flavobacterium channae]UGS22794.1 patatin-like phospholipase family protein [Flavobacterium channae]
MKKDITLVLSGGGARGIAHIGVIEELLKLNVNIASISGTSMGALIGGIYAVGKLEEFKQWMLKVNRTKIFKLIDFSFSTQGLVKGERVFNEIREFITDVNIEDLPIKYTATAFDIANGREVVFDKGSLFNAIRASISIPTIFTPLTIGDSVFIDGGVVNNIPINTAKRVENDIVIAVNVNAGVTDDIVYYSELEQLAKQNLKASKSIYRINKNINYFFLVNNSLVTMTNHISNLILEKNPPDVLVEIPRNVAGIFEFYNTKAIINSGKEYFANSIPEIELKI